MKFPKLTKKHWFIIATSLAIITCLTIVTAAITSTNNPVTIETNQNIITFTTTTQEPYVITPEPTPTAPYKIIPRNSTYIPSKPIIEPINPNYNYSISINPPFDNTGPTGTVGIHKGTIFEISGTTDLPVGTELMIEVSSSGGSPTQKKRPEPCQVDTIGNGRCIDTRNLFGTIYVEPSRIDTKNCTPPINTWRFIVDSKMINPDEYIISVSSIDDNLNPNHQYASNYTTFYILESSE